MVAPGGESSRLEISPVLTRGSSQYPAMVRYACYQCRSITRRLACGSKTARSSAVKLLKLGLFCAYTMPRFLRGQPHAGVQRSTCTEWGRMLRMNRATMAMIQKVRQLVRSPLDDTKRRLRRGCYGTLGSADDHCHICDVGDCRRSLDRRKSDMDH